MLNAAQQFVDFLLELLFGSFCLGCGARGRGIPCDACRIESAALLSDLDGAVFVDRTPVRELLRGSKFGRWRNGARWFAQQLERRTLHVPEEVLAVSWVPGDPGRVRTRGADLPRAVARSYARALGVPCIQLLIRVPHSLTQRGLHRFERDDNARESFDVHPRANARLQQASLAAAHPGGHARVVVLIDDVCTTGATLRVCQSLLTVVFRRRFPDVCIHPVALAVVPPPDPHRSGVANSRSLRGKRIHVPG